VAVWTLDDISWEAFDCHRVTPQLLSLVKAAALVEHNSRDYARYLCEVFYDDEIFCQAAREWADEEIQHGQALRKWAELADPAFDFEKSFNAFVTGYQLPINVHASVRGSRSGELTARCVVEIGTSSYYTAMKNRADEPVLKEICARIAADEFRHYKLFYTHLKHYLEKERIGRMKRLAVALGRIAESEDDELAYAFYAAHHAGSDVPYDHKTYKARYLACAYPVYQQENVEKMISMVMKAIGLAPKEWVNRWLGKCAWTFIQRRAKSYAPQAA
jgi:hypothetical protein